MIRIHNFARGARGLRLCWQCEEMGLLYETAAVTYPPSEAYLALNPIGNVPFLEDDGGVAINESVAIMLHLAGRYGPTPLLPTEDPAVNARVVQLTVFSEASIGAGMNTLMAAHFGAPEADKRNWSVRGVERSVEQAFDHVAAVLGDSRFLVGDDLTLADIAIGTTLSVWRGALGKSLPDRLAAYQAGLAARPAYQRARERTQQP